MIAFEKHLQKIQSKIDVHMISLKDAIEFSDLVESIYENALSILNCIDPVDYAETWIRADNNVMVWSNQLTEAILDVTRQENTLNMLIARKHAVLFLMKKVNT